MYPVFGLHTWENVSRVNWQNYGQFSFLFVTWSSSREKHRITNENSEKIFMFENSKGLIRRRKLEDKSCNKERVNRPNKDLQDPTLKTKDWTTRTQIKPRVKSCSSERSAINILGVHNSGVNLLRQLNIWIEKWYFQYIEPFTVQIK